MELSSLLSNGLNRLITSQKPAHGCAFLIFSHALTVIVFFPSPVIDQTHPSRFHFDWQYFPFLFVAYSVDPIMAIDLQLRESEASLDQRMRILVSQFTMSQPQRSSPVRSPSQVVHVRFPMEGNSNWSSEKPDKLSPTDGFERLSCADLLDAILTGWV